MRFPPASPNSLLRSLLRRSAAAAALCAIACLQSHEPGDYFRLEARPELLAYSRVAIRLDDTTGRRLAVLYDDTLPDLRRLERLPAQRYAGGTVRILIEGYKGPRLAYRETRLYEGRTQRLLDLIIERFKDSAGGNPDMQSSDKAQHWPAFSAFPKDTIVSIRDNVPLIAEAVDADGDLAAYAWDCGPGGPKDSATVLGSAATIRFGVRYSDPGERVCRLRLWDLRMRSAEAQVRVKVELDPPWADAGRDTTVSPGSRVRMHAGGEDGLGPIVSRAWSIDGAPFQPVPQIETTFPAPLAPGDILCILKVIDSDSLFALDTLVIHVVSPAGDHAAGAFDASRVTP